MRCVHPITIANPAVKNAVIREYRPDGTLVTIFGEVLEPRIQVPCGRCIVCQNNRRDAWAARMELESRSSACTYFVTLTYNEENLPGSLQVIDLQKFFRRFRKLHQVRYFAVGEYGGRFGRPHYHCILWFSEVVDSARLEAMVSSTWPFGFVDVREASYNQMRYCAKYTVKAHLELEEGKQPPFAVMSRRPGIGFEFFDSVRDFDRSYINLSNGRCCSLPRYLLSKLPEVEQVGIKRTRQAIAESKPKLEFTEQILRELDLERRVTRRYIEKYGKA